jgi:hypothetical protein
MLPLEPALVSQFSTAFIRQTHDHKQVVSSP